MSTRILIGHVLDRLREMPADSVHMVWTSPPYWGLRSYDTEPQVWGGDAACEHEWGRKLPALKPGQVPQTKWANCKSVAKGQASDRGSFCTICGAWRGEHGLEPTLDLWLRHEVEIFREVRRVLRPDGTLWLNIGDAYCASANGRSAADQKAAGTDDRTFRDKPFDTASASGLKPKQRLMLPARLALALQADGWWLRDEIVWSKLNPMPSSVKDRTTPAHEMLYLLTKRPRYYFDHVAIQEPCAVKDWDNGTRVYGGVNKAGANAKHGSRTQGRVAGYKRPDGWATHAGGHGSFHRDGREKGAPAAAPAATARQKRSVWPLALEPFSGAHFATAPTGIVQPAILAGTSAAGVCPQCGAPWSRVTERAFQPQPDVSTELGVRGAADQKPMDATSGWDGFPRCTTEYKTTGWSPSCACPTHKPVPATVLDPFGGSGTTALVADRLGRDAILIEMNPDYVQIARARLRESLGRVECDLPEPSCDLPMFEKLGAAS